MKYFAYTIDPLHIGSGGYRLGRVDNTIVRDPGTNLPKYQALPYLVCAAIMQFISLRKKNRKRL